jgi:ribonuclease VapC
MFLDASAMTAVIVREDDGPALAARLAQAGSVHTSPIAIYEAVLAVARIRNTSAAGAQRIVDRFLSVARAEIVPITAEIGRGAVEAFERYGRGRHAARLNMGDCFAYACARSLDVPLLFKGDDFSQTDIAVG